MTERQAAGLQLRAITKRYGEQTALHETTLKIPAGRFTSILGAVGLRQEHDPDAHCRAGNAHFRLCIGRW